MHEPMQFILLRGLTREQRHWRNFISRLQGAFPNANILTPDLPGNGQHCQVSSPTTISSMTDFVRGELAGQLTQPSCFIALSMGAMITIDWMTRFPNEGAGAVLMNTSLKGINPLLYRLRPSAFPSMLMAFLGANIGRREKSILSLTSEYHRGDKAILDKWERYAREHPVKRTNALRQLVAAARFRAPTERPRHPLLLLSGAEDQIANPSCSKQIFQWWQSPHQQHPKAGHDLPLDVPEWVVEQITAWVDSPALCH